jgi:hypothetical protein
MLLQPLERPGDIAPAVIDAPQRGNGRLRGVGIGVDERQGGVLAHRSQPRQPHEADDLAHDEHQRG